MFETSSGNKMPIMDLKNYIKFVAFVFCLSSATALSMAVLRILKPDLYYSEPLDGKNAVIHFLITGLMVTASCIGFLNSLVTLQRRPIENTGRNITMWLLLDSVFETSRVVYVFVAELVMRGDGDLQMYELLTSAAQYLIDSFLYCQMILRH